MHVLWAVASARSYKWPSTRAFHVKSVIRKRLVRVCFKTFLKTSKWKSYFKKSSRRWGKPSFDVKEEQLSFLVENDFKVPEISLMLGVSTRTVERRLSSFEISISGKLEEFVVSSYWCTLEWIVHIAHGFCCFTFNLHNCYARLPAAVRKRSPRSSPEIEPTQLNKY